MNTKTSFGIVALIVVVAIVVLVVEHTNTPAPVTISTQPINTVSYLCNAGNTIAAAFYQGTSTPAASADQPPTPGGSVALTLSDGRTMTLAQTISADGARYANADGSFVFWSKGNGAMVLENGQPDAFVGCIEVVKDPGNLPEAYQNASDGFSIRYPVGYTVDDAYAYQEMGPGKDISGVKFTISSSTAAGTNLGSDSYVSVEEIPQATSCTADLFLDQGSAAEAMTDQGTDYSVASSTGAGAGNRYEETVYAIPGTNPCIAVRYFIHYGVIENYPAGSVQAFDEGGLLAQFDAIRRTLVIAQ